MNAVRCFPAIPLLLAFLAAVVPSVAHTADGQDTGFIMGAGWGVQRLDVDLDSRALLDPVDQGFDSWGSGPELMLGKGFGPRFRTEFTFFFTEHESDNPDFAVHMGGLRATGIVSLLPGRRLQPNLLGGFGFGAVIYESDVRDDHIYAWVQGDMGLGLRVRLNRHWCLDGDFLLSILDVEREAISLEDSELHHVGGSGRVHRFGLRLIYDF